MTKFFFNNCLPSETQANVPQLFYDGVKAFRQLSKYYTIEQSWALSSLPDSQNVCGVTLKDLTDSSPLSGDRDLQLYAKRIITQYSIISQDINTINNGAELDYLRNCTFNSRPANELVGAALLGYWAFSLPLDDTLKQDILPISIKDEETGTESQTNISNFFVENLEHVKNSLNPPEEPEEKSIEEMIHYFTQNNKKCIISDEFKEQWKQDIQANIKELILLRFKRAFNGGLLFPPSQDYRKKIVRADENGTGIHELKQKGTGLRVYFNGDADTIYICLFGTKTSNQGNGQESDFKTAAAIYAQLRQQS